MNVTNPNSKEWSSLTKDNAHFMQSNFWAKVKAPTGWTAKHVVISNDKVLAGVQILVINKRSIRIGYTGRFDPYIQGEVPASDIWAALKEFAKQEKLSLLTIDPSLYLDTKQGQDWLKLLGSEKNISLGRQIQSRATAVSDLSDFGTIYPNLNKRTRYNIRNAKKRGVSIRIEPATLENLDQFWELYQETARRKGFMLRPHAYYLNLINSIKDTDFEAYFTFADHKDETMPISASFMVIGGKQAWLLYAASSMRQRNLMPNDLLEYQNLEYAAKHGVTNFDWWGAPYDKNNGSDPMHSVWLFKKRFLAQHHQLVGAWDYYPTGIKPALLKHVTKLRNSLLDGRKKLVALKSKVN